MDQCNSRGILTNVQSFVNVEEDFFEESESLGLHLLALVKHFLHVLHVLWVVGIDLLQGGLVFLLGPLHLLLGFLDALLQFADLSRIDNQRRNMKKKMMMTFPVV